MLALKQRRRHEVLPTSVEGAVESPATEVPTYQYFTPHRDQVCSVALVSAQCLGFPLGQSLLEGPHIGRASSSFPVRPLPFQVGSFAMNQGLFASVSNEPFTPHLEARCNSCNSMSLGPRPLYGIS